MSSTTSFKDFLSKCGAVVANKRTIESLDQHDGDLERAQSLIDRATQAGYSAMLLDTLDEMESARELYAALGFQEVAPYYFNPIPGAHYLKVNLG